VHPVAYEKGRLEKPSWLRDARSGTIDGRCGSPLQASSGKTTRHRLNYPLILADLGDSARHS
jgi:hypothetical protein